MEADYSVSTSNLLISMLNGSNKSKQSFNLLVRVFMQSDVNRIFTDFLNTKDIHSVMETGEMLSEHVLNTITKISAPLNIIEKLVKSGKCFSKVTTISITACCDEIAYRCKYSISGFCDSKYLWSRMEHIQEHQMDDSVELTFVQFPALRKASVVAESRKLKLTNIQLSELKVGNTECMSFKLPPTLKKFYGTLDSKTALKLIHSQPLLEDIHVNFDTGSPKVLNLYHKNLTKLHLRLCASYRSKLSMRIHSGQKLEELSINDISCLNNQPGEIWPCLRWLDINLSQKDTEKFLDSNKFPKLNFFSSLSTPSALRVYEECLSREQTKLEPLETGTVTEFSLQSAERLLYCNGCTNITKFHWIGINDENDRVFIQNVPNLLDLGIFSEISPTWYIHLQSVKIQHLWMPLNSETFWLFECIVKTCTLKELVLELEDFKIWNQLTAWPFMKTIKSLILSSKTGDTPLCIESLPLLESFNLINIPSRQTLNLSFCNLLQLQDISFQTCPNCVMNIYLKDTPLLSRIGTPGEKAQEVNFKDRTLKLEHYKEQLVNIYDTDTNALLYKSTIE